MAFDEVTPNDLVEVVQGQVLSGPEDSIFDCIFDWIANGIDSVVSAVTGWVSRVWSAITETITSWITWLWSSITTWFEAVFERLRSGWDYVTSWITTSVSQVWDWITTGINTMLINIGDWFSEQWSRITELMSSWAQNIGQWWANVLASISRGFESLYLQLDAWFTWLGDFIREQVVAPMVTWWDGFLDKLFTPSEWLGKLMDAVTGWFTEDIPGSSPRWTGIFEAIGDWFVTWFVKFPSYMAENFPQKVAYGLSTSFKWLGDTFNDVFESFSDAIIGLARQLGPMSPGNAMTGYASLAKVGLASLGGLAGMTVAGEFLNPLSHLGLGHISAMIYDMTNYKLITGAFMGAITVTMLKTPLTYYFNDIFRPWLLSPRDFMELMSREAFTEPEKLQEPALVSAMHTLAPGGGAAFEQSLVGYYGYPSAYHGLFKELSHTRLGYFALAGVARSGFYEKAWFIEALSRTGYSTTAREALLRMYEVQVKDTRQGIVLPQLRRQLREGYASPDEARVTLERVAGTDDLDEIRMLAIKLEQETALKDLAVDIHLSSFTRGVIPESECISNLRRLIKSEAVVDLQMMRTKLGLMRRLSIAVQEPQVAPFQFVEEE